VKEKGVKKTEMVIDLGRERESKKKVKIKRNVWTIGSLTNRWIQKGSVDSYCDGSYYLHSVPRKPVSDCENCKVPF